MPAKWAERRPEELSPEDFLHLTADLFQGRLPADGPLDSEAIMSSTSRSAQEAEVVESRTNTKDVPYLCNQKRGVWRGAVM